MKKSTLRRLLLLCLCLTLVTVSLIGGTLAKYTSTVTGTGSATVAQWNFTAGGEAQSFSFNLTGSGTEGKLVPGDKGTFTIALAAGADVPVKWTASLTSQPSGNFTVSLDKTSGTMAASGTDSLVISWEYSNTSDAQAALTWTNIVVSIVGEQNTTNTNNAVNIPATNNG